MSRIEAARKACDEARLACMDGNYIEDACAAMLAAMRATLDALAFASEVNHAQGLLNRRVLALMDQSAHEARQRFADLEAFAEELADDNARLRRAVRVLAQLQPERVRRAVMEVLNDD